MGVFYFSMLFAEQNLFTSQNFFSQKGKDSLVALSTTKIQNYSVKGKKRVGAFASYCFSILTANKVK